MKDLKTLLAEIAGSEELKAKFADALKGDRLADFLKDSDCAATAEEVMSLLQKTAGADSDESMSLDDMDAIAGGSVIGDAIRKSILVHYM